MKVKNIKLKPLMKKYLIWKLLRIMNKMLISKICLLNAFLSKMILEKLLNNTYVKNLRHMN